MKRYILLVFILFLSACMGKENVSPIPAGVQATKLEDVLDNPAAYDGKAVLIVGTVGNFCCPSGSHFKFQDSGVTIDIYPKGIKIPKLKEGQPLKVYVEVKAGEKNVVFSAVGLEVQ